jgi:hypothetical protein
MRCGRRGHGRTRPESVEVRVQSRCVRSRDLDAEASGRAQVDNETGQRREGQSCLSGIIRQQPGAGQHFAARPGESTRDARGHSRECSSLGDATPPVGVQQFVGEKFRQDLAWQTVRNAWSVLSSILDSAVEYGYLAVNPARGIKFPPQSLCQDPEIFTAEAFARCWLISKNRSRRW